MNRKRHRSFQLLAVMAMLCMDEGRACPASRCPSGSPVDLQNTVGDDLLQEEIAMAAGEFPGMDGPVQSVTCDQLAAIRELRVTSFARGARIAAFLTGVESLAIGKHKKYYDPEATISPADTRGICSLASVKKLSLGPVKTLAEVSCLSKLEQLIVDSVASGDLSPLRGLTRLRLLHIGTGDPGFWIGDPDRQATGLGYSQRAAGPISDLGPLAGLKGLEVLEVVGGRIADLSALRGLTVLRVLNLSWNEISALDAIGALPRLEALMLRGNAVSDLVPVGGLQRLRELLVDDNPVVDVQPIARLSELERVELGGTKVADIRALAALPKLKVLGLCTCPAIVEHARLNRQAIKALRKRGAVTGTDLHSCRCC
jgi:hypothetical protein